LNWPTKLVHKGCEFKATPEQEQDGLLSGSNIASQSNINGRRPNSQTNAMQIWNYRGKNLMEENRLLMQKTYRRGILISNP
jgi:hypothetical protein